MATPEAILNLDVTNVKNCCSEEYAIKLHDLLNPRSLITEFFYVREKTDEEWELTISYGYNWSDFPGYEGYTYRIPAPTVAELGWLLRGYERPYWNHGTGWQIRSLENQGKYLRFDCEADATAFLLIYLIEKGIYRI